MKATVFLVHLFLGTSYPVALLAEIHGVLPSSVLSFPAFTAIYIAIGVLAVAFLDHVGKPAPTPTRPTPTTPGRSGSDQTIAAQPDTPSGALNAR